MVEDGPSERRRAWFEVCAVALTVLLYVLCYEVLDVRGVFVVGAFLAWTAYVVFRCVRDPTALDRYGLGRRGLRSAAAAVAGVVVLGLGVCWGIGGSRGTLQVSRGLLLALALYPLWGTVQQLLVQSMVVRPLSAELPSPVVVVLAAVLFGAVHLPDIALSVATAALGAVFTAIYLRWRNVWPLGIGHGLLGALFYVWVLDRDPWAEVMAGF